MIIIPYGVDTHYTLLQGHPITLSDGIPLCLAFDDDNRLMGFSFGAHVSFLYDAPSMVCCSL